MGKKEKFIKIPRSIDKDPRLQPWTKKKGVNNREVIWVVERMIARLYFEEDPLEIDDLINGLHNNHLSYLFLKDMVLNSGFFHVEGEHIKYDWERFAQIPGKKQPDEENDGAEADNENRSCVAGESLVNRSLTHARTSSSANRRVQYIEKETETENNDEDKEKEKKEKAAARISQLVDEWVIDPNEENMPEREEVRKWMTWLLDLREGQAPYLLSKKCAIPNIKERWYDLVVSFAEHLALNGGFKRIKNYTEAQKYMAYVFTTKGKDGKLDKNFPGVFIQNQMKEEEEAAHKAWIEKEKQRFPFEDYDPERGTRYVGNRLIPWDAPPRPDNHSVWDEDDNKWVDPEVLDARRAAGFARLEAMMAEMPLMTSSRLKSLSLALTGRRFHIRPLPGVLPRAGISPGLQPAFSGISERHGRK